MFRKTISQIMLIFTLCLFALPALTSTTVHAKDDNGAIPTVTVNGTDGTITFSDKNFGSGSGDGEFWTQILTKGRGFVVGIAGIGALVSIGVFIISFMKLGTSAGNPQARTQALTGILWSGIAAAGLGSVTLIAGLFYGALK